MEGKGELKRRAEEGEIVHDEWHLTGYATEMGYHRSEAYDATVSFQAEIDVPRGLMRGYTQNAANVERVCRGMEVIFGLPEGTVTLSPVHFARGRSW